MAFTRITDPTNNIASLANQPVEAPATLKQKFDQIGEDLKDYVNNTLLTELESSTLGSDGAKSVGLKLSQITATNVNGAVLELYNAITGIVLGQIPDNSLTNLKLGTDVKVGSLALLNTTNKTDVVSAINETVSKELNLARLQSQGGMY